MAYYYDQNNKKGTFEKIGNDISWYNDNENILILKSNIETTLKWYITSTNQKHYISFDNIIKTGYIEGIIGKTKE